MEENRYHQNSFVFFLGIGSLLMSMILLFFSFYLIPFLVWQWVYTIPGFIYDWQEQLKNWFSLTDNGAGFAVFSSLFFSALIFGLIAYFSSKKVDAVLIEQEKKEEDKESVNKGAEIKASLGLGAKIFILVALVILGVWIFQWLLTSPPPVE